MYISFCNPFKNELKLALLTIYWDKFEHDYTIERWFSITILNISISHRWYTDKKK